MGEAAGVCCATAAAHARVPAVASAARANRRRGRRSRTRIPNGRADALDTGRCYPLTVPFGIGATEIVILLIVALLVFGPKRLPEMGRSLGRGMREFKDSIQGKDRDEDRPELPQGETEPVPAARERDTV